MTAWEYSAVLVRYGEIALKSKQTRRKMISLLACHIETALKEHGIPYERVVREYGRLFVETPSVGEATEVISRVFGVVSCSPVVQIRSSLDEILNTGLAVVRQSFVRDRSFAVRARRVGEHSFSSQDIRERLGELIVENMQDYGFTVNLKCPEQEVCVEVRNERAYVYTTTIKGLGGMPTGSQGKVVCAISTGLDSPVAAYKVMKRGCIPVFVYFDNTPYCDQECTSVAIQQAQRLARLIHDYEVRLYVVPHGPDLTEVQQHAPAKLTCVMCKRNMLRLCREVAKMEGADAIVTGEIIGEQASQTTANLRVIGNAVCDYPVLRPCAGDDKSDIERIARQIGTYEFAERSLQCCTLPPEYPAVQAHLERVLAAEAEMDMAVFESEIRAAKVIKLRQGSDLKRT
ncbi:MAG: tRNA 4-thiouridine(8) synthase ThiI [Candidatus Thorarchaeota archaeon]|nr:tRNA 4-thiouridine(8) synthase ThiI [Candidatus Thorarchaeota archaeon]